MPITRREAVRRLAGAGVGVALGDGILRGQSEEILVAGKRVELLVRSISPATVRITAVPVTATESADDDSLVAAARGRVVARRGAPSNQPIRAGNLTVRIITEPPSIHINTIAGKTVQRLTLEGGLFRNARLHRRRRRTGRQRAAQRSGRADRQAVPRASVAHDAVRLLNCARVLRRGCR